MSEGVPVIRGNNLTFGQRRFIDDGFVFLTEAKAKEFANCEAVADDLVFTAAGTIGQVGIIPSDARFDRYIISNKQLRVRCDKNRVSPLFLFLWFTTEEMRKHIIGRNNGGAVPLINLGILRALPIPLPPLVVQERIANILSAYDELIENNRRRMMLLEQAARELYREWFVRLRFPGHEHTHITNMLPAGWERRRISDIAECVGGGTPSTTNSTYWEDGTITWITPTDVTRNQHLVLLDGEKKITEVGLKNSSAKMVPPHAVLMTSRASVGFFAIANREVCTNQGFISIVSRVSSFSSFLLFHLSERVEEIRAIGGGTTYPEVSRGKFREFQILIPPDRLVLHFDEQATLFLKHIRTLKQQNLKLRAARDLLLPRLMNGEIAV